MKRPNAGKGLGYLLLAFDLGLTRINKSFNGSGPIEYDATGPRGPDGRECNRCTACLPHSRPAMKGSMPQVNASQHKPHSICTKHLAEAFLAAGIQYQKPSGVHSQGRTGSLLQNRPNKSFKRTPPAPRSVTPLAVGFQTLISVACVFVYHGV
jgi:hypothetical protein